MCKRENKTWKETNDPRSKSSSAHSASITRDVALGLADGLLNYITKSHNKQRGIVSYISSLRRLFVPDSVPMFLVLPDIVLEG